MEKPERWRERMSAAKEASAALKRLEKALVDGADAAQVAELATARAGASEALLALHRVDHGVKRGEGEELHLPMLDFEHAAQVIAAGGFNESWASSIDGWAAWLLDYGRRYVAAR